MPTVINKNTGISIAVVITLVGCAYLTGGELTSMAMRQDTMEETLKVEGKEAKEWQTKAEEILDELRQLTRDNKLRIDYLEDSKRN